MSEESRNAPLSSERRLAAIVFTDVAGYSARMQQDETGTLVLVKADFARMRELCARHGGEVLKSTGDGLLLCFASVVQAVACALEIQRGFIARGPDALQHRIGIHLGDVFREDGDVAGDGVNIAARLQTKARPGTICLSQSVHDAVKGKLPMQAESLGPQQFKNITRPITVYLLTLTGSPSPAPMVQKSRAAWLVAAGLAVVAALAVVFWPKPAPVAPAAAQTPAQIVSDKSIAVLPFANMSDDKENVFFTDGVHEDVLTNLANIGALKVISRTSMLQYRSTTKSIKQIGAELGVAYILEGSVRRAGNKVRVTGQLIRTTTDEHLWAKTYDRDLTDVFAIQAELSREIVAALQAVLSPGEKARLEQHPTENIEAYDLYLRARAMLNRRTSRRDSWMEARPLLEESVRRDPNLALAWAELGKLHFGVFEYLGRDQAEMAAAENALETADRLLPDMLEVLQVRFEIARHRSDEQGMVELASRITRKYPGRQENFTTQASLARRLQRWADAIAAGRSAVALDPRGDLTLLYFWDLLVQLRRYQEAEPFVRRIREVQPDSLVFGYFLAQHSLWATGSTKEMDAMVTSIPTADRLTKGDAISIAARTGFTKGDAAEVVRLWRACGPKWRFGPTSNRTDLFTVAAALLALGRPAEARPLLEANRDQLLSVVNSGNDSATTESDLALVYAMLGEKEFARQAKVRAEKLPAVNGLEKAQLVVIEAWLGNKEASLDELARAMRTAPVTPQLLNVHVIRHDLLFRPLQGDPRFEALLNDPANNAPLF